MKMKRLKMAPGQVILCLLVVVSGVIFLSSFRFKITGTNQGYFYKTDRLTGKSWIVSALGEKEIQKYVSPSPSPTRIPFSISDLRIVSVKTTTKNYLGYAETIVENTSLQSAITVKFKIVYTEKKDSLPIDTEYYTSYNAIGAGDTVTIDIPIKDSNKQYWYTISIDSVL